MSTKENKFINPVEKLRVVPIEKVFANDYNPNSVAKHEIWLLYTSIKEDGYTQPVVTIYDEENDKYIIVDWFHRYSVMKTYKDIYEKNHWMLPIVVIDKKLSDRMASTVRHNRARGTHSIDWMSNIVFKMLEEGETDESICNKLWLEPDELLKLKHITGFSKLFKDAEYSKSFVTDKQLKFKKDYIKNNPNDKNIL